MSPATRTPEHINVHYLRHERSEGAVCIKKSVINTFYRRYFFAAIVRPSNSTFHCACFNRMHSIQIWSKQQNHWFLLIFCETLKFCRHTNKPKPYRLPSQSGHPSVPTTYKHHHPTHAVFSVRTLFVSTENKCHVLGEIFSPTLTYRIYWGGQKWSHGSIVSFHYSHTNSQECVNPERKEK